MSGSGRTVRMAIPGGNGSVQNQYCKANALPAPHCISHRVEHSVYSHGNQRSESLAVPLFPSAKCGTQSFHNSAGCKFFVESDFLPFSGIRFCIFLDFAAVGTGLRHDFGLRERGSRCWEIAGSLPALVKFCRLSEFWCLVLQPLRRSSAREYPRALSYTIRYPIYSRWMALSRMDFSTLAQHRRTSAVVIRPVFTPRRISFLK